MDTLFHGVFGAVVCSKSGLPGGRRGPTDAAGRRRFFHWTFWAAFLFGVLPDVASLGIHFLSDFFAGKGVRWHGIPDFVFFLYRVTHSLFGIAVGYTLIVLLKRSLWLPALAWPLHFIVDVPTHGDGVFKTPIFWPFSDAGFVGWGWWMHPPIFLGAWAVCICLWLIVLALRATEKQ